MFIIALLHALVQLPRWVVKRNVETCKTPGYTPSSSYSSGSTLNLVVGPKFEGWKEKSFMSKIRRLISTSTDDIEKMVKAHLARISSDIFPNQARIFHLFVNAYNEETKTITVDQYQFDNTVSGNYSIIKTFQATARAKYDEPLFEFMTVTSYFVDGGVPKDVKADSSVEWEKLLEKDVVNAISLPYYSIVFGLTMADRDPFTPSATVELKGNLDKYRQYLPYINDTKGYVENTINTFMTNGRLEVRKLNEVIKKICIEKMIAPTPTPTPKPSSGKNFYF